MRAQVGEIEIEYELIGPDGGEPIVLIAGIFQQLSFWPSSFLDQLSSAGFRVLVHDNRDVGFSTRESRPAPDLAELLSGDMSGVNYTLSDMAADTAGLIDLLGLSPAHVVGHSMGGMIAQRVATMFPERVRSLTLFGTNPNDNVTGQSSPEFLALAARPPSGDPEKDWETALEAHRICIEPETADEATLAAFLQTQVDRAPNPEMQCVPAIIASVFTATSSSPTYSEELQSLGIPTLVIHGTGDLAVAFDGGEKLSELIPNARLVALEGMGHISLDPNRWRVMADAIVEHALSAATASES